MRKMRFTLLSLSFFLFVFTNTNVLSQDFEEQRSYQWYSSYLNNAQKTIEQEAPLSREDVESYRRILEQIEKQNFPELAARARMLLFLAEETYPDLIDTEQDSQWEVSASLTENLQPSQIGTADASPQAYSPEGLAVTLTGGLLSLGLYNMFGILSDNAYRSAQNASSDAKNRFYTDQQHLFNFFAYLFLGTGILNLGLSIPIMMNVQRTEPLLPPMQSPPSLIHPGETKEMTILRLEQERMRLRRNMLQIEEETEGTVQTARTFLGIGLSSTLVLGVSLYLGSSTYDQYNQAKYSVDAERLRTQLELYRVTSIVSTLTAAAGFATSAILTNSVPNAAKIEREIEYLDDQIEALEEGRLD